jgi:hypothetical protein
MGSDIAEGRPNRRLLSVTASRSHEAFYQDLSAKGVLFNASQEAGLRWSAGTVCRF